METVIETQRLNKRYGEVVAVDDLDLSVRRGEVFGMLGPNGSGKTTTILMLLGLTEPTSGKVRVLGQNPARKPLEVKSRVGYLPDSVGFYDELTARENLGYIARLNQLDTQEADQRIDAALERMGLGDVGHRSVATFSHGMRQRLGLADVLIKHPEVVILDEPTLGLDPDAAREFLGLIRGLKDEGITVLLSSHLLHQVQAICDRVGLFNRGRMVLEGTVAELAQKVLGGAYRVHLEAEGDDLIPALEAINGVVSVEPRGERSYLIEATRDLRAEVSRRVVDSGGAVLSLRPEEPSLDDVYEQYFEEASHAA